MFVDIYSLLFYQILTFLLLAGAGKVILYILQIQITGKYKKTFFELLASMLCVVFCTALYYTEGKTVMLFLSLPAVWIIYQYHKGINIQKQNIALDINLRIWITFLIVSLSLALFTYFTLHTGNGFLNTPNPDYVFNAKNAHIIAHFGLENLGIEYFYRTNLGIAPYHYFELWFAIFVSAIYQIPTLNALLFIVFPIGLACIFLGFCTLSEVLNYSNIQSYLLALFFLFFAGLYLFFYKNIYLLNTASAFTTNVFIYPKLFSIYIFLQAFIVLFYTKRYSIAYALLLILPILFISTIIGVLLAGGVYFMAQILFTKEPKKIYITSLLAYILFAVVVFIFYYIFRDTNNAQLSQASTLPALNTAYFINIIKIFITTAIRHLVLYAPIILIFGLAVLKSREVLKIFKTKYTLFCILMYLTTLFSWAVLDNVQDAVQLFSNLTTPLIAINSFFVIIYFLKNKNTPKNTIYLTIGITLFFNIHNTYYGLLNNTTSYTEKYKKTIKENIKNISPVGVFMEQKNTKVGAGEAFIFPPNLYIPGQYLNLIGSAYHAVSLSVFDTYSDTPKEQNFLKKTTFYKFIEIQKANKEFQSIEQSQIDFVKKHKIGYMILTSNIQLPEVWLELIEKEIIDSKTGERFIIFKKP